MDALASQPPMCSSTIREPESTRRPLKVAIIGGGICGTALAVGLIHSSRHIDCHIYEKVSEYRDVGAGLSLHKNAINAMKQIDMELFKSYLERAVEIGQEDQEMATEVILAAGKFRGIKVGELGRAKGRKSISRADLLAGFLEQVPKDNISFGKQVVKIWETHSPLGTERPTTDSVAPKNGDSAEVAEHPIHIEFADGSRAHADVLIGCDGIHSTVRSYLLGEDNNATKPKNHDGWQVYRTLIPTREAVEKWGVDPKLAQTVPILLGPHGHINMIPMKKGEMLSAGVAIRGAARSDAAFGPSSSTASPPQYIPLPLLWLDHLKNASVSSLLGPHSGSSTPENSSRTPQDNGSQSPKSRGKRSAGPVLNTDLYKDYIPEAQKIVHMVAADTSASWAVADHDHARLYAHGCVAMAGDAAHAALPFAGNGAAQALEDAAVLAHLLRNYVRTREQASMALWAYQSVRMQRSQTAVEIAREYGQVYSFNKVLVDGKMVALHENPTLMMQWFKKQAAFTNEFDVAKQNTNAEGLYLNIHRAISKRRNSTNGDATPAQLPPKTKTEEVKSEEASNGPTTMGEGTSARSIWESLKKLRGRAEEALDGDDGELVERDETDDDVESVASTEKDSYDFVNEYMDDGDDELEDEEEDGSDL
ncbi:FAD/NAD(P)-binding domain-containing protein [Sordaria brevicollis]|uniref:FAD/NAD(P)-binding domain-containing protein n=1 Tax=Sordaria brevicollis TaxID=83679 RepID=A0AAE0NVV6_SORBR|nr:FAD/NAD(P)-binding domain-containing protein [Sordaria brevicollis]